MSCRHCDPLDFRRSYASVALLGRRDLREAVENVEARGIVPCITAVCPRCGKLSLIVHDARAPYVHALAVWDRVGGYLLQ